ncbi:MAG: hypothetical protein KatS3mg043_1568 [Rhodothermaceae bacterium]|nr:MAG: hypothetical protein KatS3mg043_1568 [Rhodothermaceae bacterium]
MGRTREGCGYIALHNDAFNSMDQRYLFVTSNLKPTIR